MQKIAKTEIEINPIIAHRWSPRAFSSKPVEQDKITALLEAARWSSSAFNEQPWRFIVGKEQDDSWKKILESLVEWNRNWAKTSPLLILNIAKLNFTHNNKPNDIALYDLGQAVSSMTLEAVHQDLFSHQMTGFDSKKAEELFNIPEGFKAVSVTAFGYYGDPADIPEDIAKMEKNERSRKDLNEIVFNPNQFNM